MITGSLKGRPLVILLLCPLLFVIYLNWNRLLNSIYMVSDKLIEEEREVRLMGDDRGGLTSEDIDDFFGEPPCRIGRLTWEASDEDRFYFFVFRSPPWPAQSLVGIQCVTTKNGVLESDCRRLRIYQTSGWTMTIPISEYVK